MFHVGQQAFHEGWPVIVVRRFNHTPNHWQNARGYNESITNSRGVPIREWPVGARYLVIDQRPRLHHKDTNIWGVDATELTAMPMLGGKK